MTLEVPDALKALAESRAAEAGFADVSQFLAQLILGEAACAPAALSVDSDAAIGTLLASRINGPFVAMDAADFAQMRKKFEQRLASAAGHP